MGIEKLTSVIKGVEDLKHVVAQHFATIDAKNVDATIAYLIDKAGFSPDEWREHLLGNTGIIWPQPKRKIRPQEGDDA